MNKKKVIVPIVASILTLGILTGVSYAYFSAKITENNKTETVIKSNELEVVFTGTQEIIAEDAIPGDVFTKKFTVKNTSNVAVKFNIYLENITNEFNEDLVYTLSDEDGVVVSETVLPTTSTAKNYLIEGIPIESGVTKSYTMKVEFKYSTENQDALQGAIFKAILGIDTNKIEINITKSSQVLANVSEVLDDQPVTGTIKIVNDTSKTQTYDLMLSDLVDIEELSTEYIGSYSLSKNEEEVITNEELPTTDQVILENQTIEPSKTDNYTISIDISVNLYNIIKTNASNETIDFSVRSGTSGTNGIYTTTATEGNVPVYYYRGKVDNNIIFNNMCWKIVRTTETGGVKLIYNGTPTDGQCLATGDATQIGKSAFNTSYNDNAYVGYMYGTAGSSTYAETHTNTNESTIKKESIDPWFAANFNSEAIAKLEDTVFCNDRSTTTGTNNNTLGSSYGSLGYGTKLTAYGVTARASYYTTTPNPSLVCPNANDKFTVSTANGNGALTYPVGLITLDETVLAGFNTKESNSSGYFDSNYLCTNSDYWTFSPVYMHYGYVGAGAYVGVVAGAGDVFSDRVNYTRGVRPAVSLADGTLVTGKGTRTNPYVVQ